MRRAAEIGLRIDVNELLPHKRLHRRLRCAGKLTHLVGRGATDRAQQLQDRNLMRRASAAADFLLRLLERDGKTRIFELLVAHDALFRPLDGQELLLHKPVQRARGIFVAKRHLQCLQRAAPTMRKHGLERQPPLLGAAAQRECRIGIQLRRSAVDRADPIPDAGRQDRVQRIVDSTEKAVMHPDGEPDQLRREDRLRIELTCDGLELRIVLCLIEREHHTLARAIAARKRHHDAAAGAERLRQRLRDLIRIRSVKRKRCSQNGDLCDRDLQHLRASSPKKSGG